MLTAKDAAATCKGLMIIPIPARIREQPAADGFGRRITYLRVSVTDRCDFRCVYCMAQDPEFLPRAELLTLEELGRLCSAFIAKGVRRLRLTGGEPLVRKNIMRLVHALSRHLQSGALDELTLTTNGSQLAKYADELASAGVRRINVSLDTLNPAKFKIITRFGDFAKVTGGIRAALKAGIKIKINMVALRGVNEDEIEPMVRWCHAEGMDLTLIETMPLGETEAHCISKHLPLSAVRARLMNCFTLDDIPHRTGGPARYVHVRETGGRLGFITPLSHNFCETCNRVRVTCTGRLYMCLGQNNSADLAGPLRISVSHELLHTAIDEAIARKPQGHSFNSGQQGPLSRQMSVTGG